MKNLKLFLYSFLDRYLITRENRRYMTMSIIVMWLMFSLIIMDFMDLSKYLYLLYLLLILITELRKGMNFSTSNVAYGVISTLPFVVLILILKC